MRKAQITIEYVIIIGIVMVFFTAVTLPLSFRVSDASRDVEVVTEMQSNLDSISSAIRTANAQGPGSVRTVEVISSRENWSVLAYSSDVDGAITYGIYFASEEDVPPEISTGEAVFGAMGRDIEGIANSGTASSFNGSGKGRWKVRVENSNYGGGLGELQVGDTLINDTTINITIISR